MKRIVEENGLDKQQEDDATIDLSGEYIQVADFEEASKKVKPSA